MATSFPASGYTTNDSFLPSACLSANLPAATGEPVLSTSPSSGRSTLPQPMDEPGRQTLQGVASRPMWAPERAGGDARSGDDDNPNTVGMEMAGLERIARSSTHQVEDAAFLTAGVGRHMDQCMHEHDLARQEQALQYLRGALAVQERTLGAGHLATAATCYNIGMLLMSQGMLEEAARGRLEEALEHFHTSLVIYEKQLGAGHPATAPHCYGIGSSLSYQSKFEQALPYFQKALARDEAAHGRRSLDTATYLDAIGTQYSNLGQYEKAISYYSEARKIRELLSGPGHLDVALSCNNIAMLHMKRNRGDEAIKYFQLALSIFENQVGPRHPYTVIASDCIASLATAQSEQARGMAQSGETGDAERTSPARAAATVEAAAGRSRKAGSAKVRSAPESGKQRTRRLQAAGYYEHRLVVVERPDAKNDRRKCKPEQRQ